MNPSILVPAHPTADLAAQEVIRTARRIEGVLREATLDVFGSVGFSPTRDLYWQVTDDDAITPGLQQPPWYQQNVKRGETIPVYQTEQQLRLIRDRSRILCYYNEFALCGLENRKNYVVGEDGLKYSAQPCRPYRHDKRAHQLAAQVQEFIDVFVEVNDLHEMERETVHRWDEEGEAAIRLFEGDADIPVARFVEPEHIRAPGGDQWEPALSFGIETDPHDIRDVRAYWIVENPLDDMWEPTRIPERDVCHATLNVKGTSKRGLPTYFPVGENLRRCEDLLASLTSMAKARAKVALIRKLTGTTSDVASTLLRNLTSIRVTDPATAEELSVERLRYGSVLTAGQNAEYQFPPGQISGAEYVEVLQAELRAVAARLQMPEWMFTALADAKYSNAFVVEAPTKKAFGVLQRKLCRFFGEAKVGVRRSLLWRAVGMAVKAGILDEACLELVDIVATGPTLEARDKAAEANSNKTYAEMGIKSDDTIRDEQGLDAETEDLNLAKQRERKRAAGRKEIIKDAMEIVKEYHAGALSRPAACALLESIDFTREEAEALLPLAAGVDRTAAGRQQAQQMQQQQMQMAAQGGAPGGEDDENPLMSALGGPDDQGGPSDAQPGPSPSGAPGGGAGPLAESYFAFGTDRRGLALVENFSGESPDRIALLEAGFTGTVTASNGAVFYYVDGRRVANPYKKNAGGAAKPLASHHGHEVAKAHQSRAKEAAQLALEYPDGLTPAHMESLAVSLSVLPTSELRDLAKKLGGKVQGKLKDDVVSAVVQMFPMPTDGKVPELPETSAGAGSADEKSGLVPPAPAPDTAGAKTHAIVTDINQMIEIQAAAFEKRFGWSDENPKEGFVKNWKKSLKKLEPDPAAVADLTPSIDAAFKDYDLPAVPVFIRKQTPDEKAGGENGHWDDGGFVVLSDDAVDERKYHSKVRPLATEHKMTVKESYKDVITGLVVHELGHKLHFDKPELIQKAHGILADAETKKNVSRLISGYASTHPAELVAEAYTMRKHPDFGSLAPETQSLVRKVLGEPDTDAPDDAEAMDKAFGPVDAAPPDDEPPVKGSAGKLGQKAVDNLITWVGAAAETHADPRSRASEKEEASFNVYTALAELDDAQTASLAAHFNLPPDELSAAALIAAATPAKDTPAADPASEKPAGLSDTAKEHAAAIAAIIEHNKKLKKNHGYIADKVNKYGAKNVSDEDWQAIHVHAGLDPVNDKLAGNINKYHAALKGANEGGAAAAQPEIEEPAAQPETPKAKTGAELHAELAKAITPMWTAGGSPVQGDPKQIVAHIEGLSDADKAALGAYLKTQGGALDKTLNYWKSKAGTAGKVPAAPAAQPETPASSISSIPSLSTEVPDHFPKAADLGALKTVGKLGGSTGAEKVEHNGKQYVKKSGASPEHVTEEHLADTLYKIAGASTPAGALYDQGGKPVKLAEFIDGKPLGSLTGEAREKAHAELRKHFVADALFGNWDVIGMGGDNVLVDASGKVHRIDNGGSLRFRAQGKPKGAAFGDDATGELDSFRDSAKNPDAAQVFGGITDAEIRAQIADLDSKRGALLGAIPDAVLRDRVAKRLDSLKNWNPGAEVAHESVKVGQTLKPAQVAKLGNKTLRPGGTPPPPDSYVRAGYVGSDVLPADTVADHKEWQSAITKAEQQAVASYTGSGYTNFNRALIDGGTLSPTHAAKLNAINGAWAKSPTYKPPILAYRGLKMSAANAEHLYQLATEAAANGHKLQMAGGQSTSINWGTAEAFAGGTGAGVMFEVVTHQGPYTGYGPGGLGAVSSCPQEQEILQPHNSVYRVHGVKEVKYVDSYGTVRSRKIIQVEQVPGEHTKPQKVVKVATGVGHGTGASKMSANKIVEQFQGGAGNLREQHAAPDTAKPHEDAHAAANVHEAPPEHNEITRAKIAAQDEDLNMRSFKVVE